MSFWKSDRFEYIRQPHIVVLLVIIVLALATAALTGVRRVQDMRRVASLDTYDACMEFVADEPLCRFAAADQASPQTNYIITSTATSSDGTELSTLEVESPDRMKSVTFEGPIETEAFVVIDAVSFVKDYTDGMWAMYEDPDFIASEPQTNVYDFSSVQAESTVELRDYYQHQGTEPCGEHTCYKYRILGGEDQATESYIWFDDTDFLLRRHLTIASGATTNNQFEYRQVIITAPTPTKTVSEEEFAAFLEDN